MIKRLLLNFSIAFGALSLAVIAYWLLSKPSSEYNLFDLLRGNPMPANAPILGQQQSPLLTNGSVNPNDFKVLSQVNNALADVTELVVPAVVSIDTKKRSLVRKFVPSDPFGFYGSYESEVREQAAGLGSGAIVSEDGLIVTNHHVVEGVDEIQITAHDGSKYEADWVGSDPSADIAVLKIRLAEGEKKKFQPLKFGDSNRVRVGEMALAVGNPFGLNETVTRGIISAKQRQLSDTGNEYFQVDAVINPGNSGGPLVNIHGEIIGINVAIFSGQQNVKVWQGIGLAIPSNEAKEIYEAIALNRPLQRGYLGVGLENVPAYYARQLNLKNAEGAFISGVAEDSPADNSGMLAGDVVLEFEGKRVTSAHDFITNIRRKKDGESANLKVMRQGSLTNIEVQFGSRSGRSTLKIAKVISSSGRKTAEALGITVQNITNQQRRVLNIKENIPAILIADVTPDSMAASQFKSGDLIHKINEQSTSTIEEFYDLLGNLSRDKPSTLVWSRNGRVYRSRLE